MTMGNSGARGRANQATGAGAGRSRMHGSQTRLTTSRQASPTRETWPPTVPAPAGYLSAGAGLTSLTTPTLSRNLKYASSSVAATGPYSALTASRI